MIASTEIATPKRHELRNSSLPPIFIAGAGRSGTTLLYKLLCLHSDIAWISNYLNRFPNNSWITALNLITKLSKKSCRTMWFGRNSNAYFTNRKLLKRAFPMPVEGESIYRRCGMPTFPHKTWRISRRQEKCLVSEVEKIRLFQRGRVFLNKRTANNRRITQLTRAFPKAKFLHVMRDGRAVANSLLRVSWWMDHKVWWWHQKTPRQWEAEGNKPVELAARNWVEEVAEIQNGLKLVPKELVFELKYEDLIESAEATLRKIVNFVGLDNDLAWIDEIRSLNITNQNIHWQTLFGDSEKEILQRVQSKLLKRLGYI